MPSTRTPSRRPCADERYVLFEHVLRDAVEAPEEVEVPPRAAELAVGDPLKTELFLFADHALDLAILDGGEPGRIERAGGELPTRVLQGRRAQ